MTLGAKRVIRDDDIYTDYSELWGGWFIRRDYRIVSFPYSAYEPNTLLREETIHISDVSDDLKAFLESERLVSFSKSSNH